MMNDVKYTQSHLLWLGFSKKLIEDLLPEPILRRNPHYSKGSPMKLYDGNAVETAMKTEVFLKHKEGSAKRKEAAQRAVETKISNLIAVMEEKAKNIQVHKVEDVLSEVLEDKYDTYESDFSGYNPYDADENTKRRWAVNYIRHNLTSYDFDLYRMAGKPGCDRAYDVYKNGVLDKIADVYPEFKEECESQKRSIY